MSKVSAGILLYDTRPSLEVLLVHPGGPFFKKKDLGSWSIPKGEVGPDEDMEIAARREFFEEIGICIEAPAVYLEHITQKGGKKVHAWACQSNDSLREHILNADIASITTRFEMEWPPRSGKRVMMPEVDAAVFFTIEVARAKMMEAQAVFLDRLLEIVVS